MTRGVDQRRMEAVKPATIIPFVCRLRRLVLESRIHSCEF